MLQSLVVYWHYVDLGCSPTSKEEIKICNDVHFLTTDFSIPTCKVKFGNKKRKPRQNL